MQSEKCEYIYRAERRERKLYVFAQYTEAVYIKENKFS